MRVLFFLLSIFIFSSLWSYAQTKYMTGFGYYGCTLISDYEKITKYLEVKDEKAANILIDSNRCIFLKSAVDVQIMRYGPQRRTVQIRMIGTEATVWTSKDALIQY